MLKKYFNQKGFTLIELLVVVAIISLLSSVILASIKDAKDKAEQTAYRVYMSEVIKAAELYRTDSDLNFLYDNYFSIDEAIDTTTINRFIQKTKIPSFFDPDNWGILYFLGSEGTYSCEGDTGSDYVIYFGSPRTDLQIPHLYFFDTEYSNYYCASISIK
jgi:prepilin-type N-terminal cleavage/methylation domain-containing protein